MITNTNKLTEYNEIIKALQYNDRNATYDEILEDYDNDITEAIQVLKSVLERIIDDEGLEGEELDFYKVQLTRVNSL